MDDPDGLGGPTNRERAQAEDQEGWDLDAPIVAGDVEPDSDEV
jgi:hypothetical protein